ncbi:MAG TPA: DUF4349 domain-containing protein [Chloroflexia bacterium]|nr:DUF4349 domain-containing protein [Chloroflexia bacterium]
MDTEIRTGGATTVQRRKFPRKWILLAVAGLLVASVIMVPLGLSLVSYSSNMLAAAPSPVDRDASMSPMPTPAAAYGLSAESTDGRATTDVAQNTAQPWDRMIIRTGTLHLTVKDVGDSIQRVRAVANASGGYVFSSETRNEGEYTYATITLYIPAAGFDQVLPELRALGGQVTKVANESISSSDVTEEYTDLNSQLRNLKATEGRMLALQSKAERMEDILAIDRELRAVQAEIERIQGRMNYLGKRAEMSSLTVYLSPVVAPTPLVEPQPVWHPLKAAQGAWNASLELLAAAGTAIITAVVFLWWLAPLLAAVVWALARARRRTTAAGSADAGA